jgi:hypothetical protein
MITDVARSDQAALLGAVGNRFSLSLWATLPSNQDLSPLAPVKQWGKCGHHSPGVEALQIDPFGPPRVRRRGGHRVDGVMSGGAFRRNCHGREGCAFHINQFPLTGGLSPC